MTPLNGGDGEISKGGDEYVLSNTNDNDLIRYLNGMANGNDTLNGGDGNGR